MRRFTTKKRNRFLVYLAIPLVLLFLGLFVWVRLTQAATATWTNGGGDGLWSTCTNWSGGTGTGGCPGTSDIATFNTTSTANVAIDANVSVAGINIASGYIGQITQNTTRTVTVGSSNFVQADGTFLGGDSTIDINGSFTLSGGNFTSTSGTMTISSNLTISGSPVFTHNSGTITFDGNNTASALSCNSVTFNLVTITKTNSNASVTVNSGCTIPLGNSPTSQIGSGAGANGTITNSGGTITVGTGTWTINGGNYTQSSGTSTLTGTTALDVNGSLTLTSGTFTAASLTTLSIEKNLDNSGSLLPNSLNMTLDGNNTASSLTCGTVTFNLVTITKTNSNASVTVNSGCTIPLGNSPTSQIGSGAGANGTITNSGGTITVGTGTWTINGGNYTQSSGTSTLTGTTALDVNGSLTLTSGTFTAASLTTLSIEKNLDNSGSLLPNSLNMTLDGNNTASSLTCGTVTFNLVTITKTGTTASVTVNSGCTIPFGNSPTVTLAPLGTSANGTLTNNGGTINVGTGTWTNNGNFTQSSGTTTFSGTTIDINDGGLTLTSGTFTASSLATLSIEKNLDNSGNLLPSGLALTLDGTNDQDDSTLTSCGNATFSSFTINKTFATGTTTFASNCTATGAFTRTDGTVNNSASAYTLTVQGDFSMSTTDAFGGANLTVSLTGSNTQAISQNAANTFSSPFQVNKSGNVASLSTNLTGTTAACTVVEGIFDINGKAFTCGGTFTVQDGGTLRLYGSETPTSPTLDAGSTVSFKGDGDGLADTYTVTTFKTQYSNLSIDSTDSGDTYQLGVALDINKNLTVTGGTFDVSSGNYDLNIGGNFTNNATFNARSGAVIFDDATQTSTLAGSGSPAITFNNLTVSTAGKALQFTAGETFRTNGLLTLTGTSGSNVTINSTTSSQWFINHQGTESITYTTVTNSGCDGSSTNITLDATDTNGGNNGACWAFPGGGSNIDTQINGDTSIEGNVQIGN